MKKLMLSCLILCFAVGTSHGRTDTDETEGSIERITVNGVAPPPTGTINLPVVGGSGSGGNSGGGSGGGSVGSNGGPPGTIDREEQCLIDALRVFNACKSVARSTYMGDHTQCSFIPYGPMREDCLVRADIKQVTKIESCGLDHEKNKAPCD